MADLNSAPRPRQRNVQRNVRGDRRPAGTAPRHPARAWLAVLTVLTVRVVAPLLTVLLAAAPHVPLAAQERPPRAAS
ncbi:MAG: hypothetical protein WKG32_23135, partial [Gemmatimonadaceae bacterium]